MFSWVTSLTKKDPKEVVRKCRAEIRSQKRDIDRNISNLTVEQRKAERSIREAAKRNDIQSARVRLGRL
jgi:charged multivesicular body protein 3